MKNRNSNNLRDFINKEYLKGKKLRNIIKLPALIFDIYYRTKKTNTRNPLLKY